jgi:Arc/MetJ-type ribon-helix-helix transcriptional regulator
MATRTVRLDAESERMVDEMRRKTGLSVSDVLKEGIRALRDEQSRKESPLPIDVYRRLDLGPGGYSSFPATAVREGVREALRRKHRR